MSMNLSIYVGPYLEVDKTFDLYGVGGWDSLVCDGRGESGVHEEKLILIPNQKLLGITRQMSFDRYTDTEVVSLSESMLTDEKAAFRVMADPLFEHCKSHGIPVRLRWGIVPRYS